GRIVAISTPWGRSNLFYRLFEQASSGAHADMVGITEPTWRVNPTLDQAFFERERAKDPELFEGEFGASFLQSGGLFLDYTRILAAVDEDRFELPPDAIVNAAVGFDPSFSKDNAGLAVVGRDREQHERLRLALVRSWSP